MIENGDHMRIADFRSPGKGHFGVIGAQLHGPVDGSRVNDAIPGREGSFVGQRTSMRGRTSPSVSSIQIGVCPSVVVLRPGEFVLRVRDLLGRM